MAHLGFDEQMFHVFNMEPKTKAWQPHVKLKIRPQHLLFDVVYFVCLFLIHDKYLLCLYGCVLILWSIERKTREEKPSTNFHFARDAFTTSVLWIWRIFCKQSTSTNVSRIFMSHFAYIFFLPGWHIYCRRPFEMCPNLSMENI